MNSTNPQRPKLSPQEEAQLKMALELQQLRRVLWLVVNSLPDKTVKLDESAIPPLWQLAGKRPETENQSILQLTAETIPEPSEEVIQRLAKHLKGTGLHLAEVVDKFNLANYPVGYVELRLVPYVRYGEDRVWSPDPAAALQDGQRN